jgi:spore coat polysaccharide biosynthesis protein SpsF
MNKYNFSGLITVRTSSSRLPKKCLLPFGDSNVIVHIINRAKFYNIEPIICTSTDQSDDIIELIAKNEGVKVFRGHLINKLKRWSDCVDYFNINEFHTIDADDPFFDGFEMERSMSLLKIENADVITTTKTSASGAASVGYSFSSKLINKASSLFSGNTDTELIWNFLDKVEGIKMISLPETKNPTLKMRLTLDYEEDYWLLSSLNRILGKNISRDKVEDFFKNNPEFYLINWFRNVDYHKNQNNNNS